MSTEVAVNFMGLLIIKNTFVPRLVTQGCKKLRQLGGFIN